MNNMKIITIESAIVSLAGFCPECMIKAKPKIKFYKIFYRGRLGKILCKKCTIRFYKIFYRGRLGKILCKKCTIRLIKHAL